MTNQYTENKTFKNNNYSEAGLGKGEYENCTFFNCIFTNTDLSEIKFIECDFDTCDLSNAKLIGTAFQDIVFRNCKLFGLHFDDCNTFLLSFRFEECILNFSSFYKLKIKNTYFKDCKLEEVEFVETDLTNSIFQNCDLNRAVFGNTILEKTDFRTSINYSIDPKTNRIRKAKFSVQGIVGLLDKYDIFIE